MAEPALTSLTVTHAIEWIAWNKYSLQLTVTTAEGFHFSVWLNRAREFKAALLSLCCARRIQPPVPNTAQTTFFCEGCGAKPVYDPRTIMCFGGPAATQEWLAAGLGHSYDALTSFALACDLEAWLARLMEVWQFECTQYQGESVYRDHIEVALEKLQALAGPLEPLTA